MDDTQLQALANNAQAVADRLATESRYVDAAVVMGLLQAVRALRAKLEPVESKPVLKAVE